MSQQLLSYYDALVTQDDYDTLARGHWLNDNIISFVFEYIDRNVNHGHHVTLLDPSVCQAIKLTNQADEILAGRDLLSFSAVSSNPSAVLSRGLLCIVSDSDSPDQPGGTHWSLLAVQYRPRGGADAGCSVLSAMHADSMAGSGNSAAAAMLLSALHPALCNAARCQRHRMPAKATACAQQRNGYDCGAYALAFAERLLAVGPEAWERAEDLRRALQLPPDAEELRTRYRRLIMQLQADGPVYK